jgi:hypothetical protein
MKLAYYNCLHTAYEFCRVNLLEKYEMWKQHLKIPADGGMCTH